MRTDSLAKIRKEISNTVGEIGSLNTKIIFYSVQSSNLMLGKPETLTAAEKRKLDSYARRMDKAIQDQNKLYAKLRSQLGRLESLKSAK